MSLINDALKRASQAQRSQRAPRIPDEILKPVEEGAAPAIPPPPPQPKRLSPAFWRIFLAVGLFGSSTLVVLEWWLIQLEAHELTVAKSRHTRRTGKHPGGATNATVAMNTNTPPATNSQILPPILPQPPAVTNPAVAIIGVVPPPLPAVTNATPPDPVPPKPLPPEFTLFIVPPVIKVPDTNASPVTGDNSGKKTNGVASSVELHHPFPRLKLQGIIHRTRNPLALINNQHLGVGDTIEEARIIRIEKSSVTFEFFGRTNEVWLLK